MKVTIANMIDNLMTVNQKIFKLEDKKRDENAFDDELVDATRLTNTLNVQRNALIEEIDLALNDIAMGERQQLFGSNKMYGK
jgi:hypothetical protein